MADPKVKQEPAPGMLPNGELNVVEEGSPRVPPRVINAKEEDGDDVEWPEDFSDLIGDDGELVEDGDL